MSSRELAGVSEIEQVKELIREWKLKIAELEATEHGDYEEGQIYAYSHVNRELETLLGYLDPELEKLRRKVLA
jgi:hypothetical protein